MTLPTVWFERSPVGDLESISRQVTVLAPPAGDPDPYAGIEAARGIVAGALGYGAEVMDRAPGLLVIGRTGIGVDSVDLEAATARGIAVTNAPEAPTISTAEHAVLLMLAAAKELPDGQNSLRRGDTDLYGRHHGLELAGKTLGLVGFGRIARRVALTALALELRVVAFDPFVPQMPEAVERVDDLYGLTAEADVVSVHIPLTSDTRHLCDGEFFQRCRHGVVFVNTARGGLVDQAALLAALDSGQVRSAGLDVTDPEPLPPDHPLLHHDRVIVTPHIATATDEGRRKNFEGGYLQVLDVLAGRKPPHLVNPDVWPTVKARLEQA